MAYKFQLGVARLSGSVVQEGEIKAVGNADDDGLISGSAGLQIVDAALFGSSIAATGSITAGSSFIIGSADLNETDMEKLDGITNGTVAAAKAVVVDNNKDASGFNSLTAVALTASATVTATGNIIAGGSFVIGSADMDETDLEKLDGITNGTAAASKAVVLDASKDVSGINSLTAVALTASATVTATGNVIAGGSFVIGSADMDETDLEKLDGITNGTAAASKAVVLGANKNIGVITSLTASTITAANLIKMGNAEITEAELEQIDGITAGTATASKALVLDSDGMVTFGDGTMGGIFGANADANQLRFGAGADFSLFYDEAQSDVFIMAQTGSKEAMVAVMAQNDQDASMLLVADTMDDAGDAWQIQCKASNQKLIFGNDKNSAGTYVEHFSITPHATVANSQADFRGSVVIAGNLTVQGSTTTVDSTTINISSSFTFEGPADDHETVLSCGSPAADTTLELFQGNAGTYFIPAFSSNTIKSTVIATTAAELNVLDGGNARNTVTIADGDGFVFNDDGTMKQINAASLKSYIGGNTNVNLKDDTETLAVGFNYFANLGGAEAVNLPASPEVGNVVQVKAPANCSEQNTLTVNRQGSHTIDGETSIVLESPNAAVSFVYVVNNVWKIY